MSVTSTGLHSPLSGMLISECMALGVMQLPNDGTDNIWMVAPKDRRLRGESPGKRVNDMGTEGEMLLSPWLHLCSSQAHQPIEARHSTRGSCCLA
jgi:hypothetical protein